MDWFSVLVTSIILFLVAIELDLFTLTLSMFGRILYNIVAPGHYIETDNSLFNV